MTRNLKYITIDNLPLRSGKTQDVSISYQVFGREIHTAPIILVNHALTGNSSIDQWWGPLVGPGKALDTSKYTLLAFDIPGNGFDGSVDRLIYNFQDWCLGDVALAFAKAIQTLNITTIDIGIGGSIGGALLWEMLAVEPDLFHTIVPIAADWKATDWLIACCHVQESILQSSNKPLEVARQHAMTFYRSPQGLEQKFYRKQEDQVFAVKRWLNHHGKRLEERFTLPAYQLLNRLLWTTQATKDFDGSITSMMAQTKTGVHMIAVDSDGFFTAAQDKATFNTLKDENHIEYHEIQSVHGHDAFLIEHDQMSELLEEIFEKSITGVAI